jgi:hypothetical protein
MLREHRGFSSGLVLEPPQSTAARCGRFAASGETSRLLRAGFGYERVCRPCRFRVSEGGSFTGGARARLAFSSLFTEADRRPAAQQLLQRLKTNISVAVPKLGERRRSERNLGEWRQPLVDKPLQPAQRCSFVAGRIGVGQQFAQQERVGE